MLDVYKTGMIVVTGRPQSVKGREETGRARPLCAYDNLWTQNSAIGKELCDGRVEDNANATHSA